MIILPKYLFTLTNFISSLCTEISRPNSPVTEMAQTEMTQTETARPNSRVPFLLNGCTTMLPDNQGCELVDVDLIL